MNDNDTLTLLAAYFIGSLLGIFVGHLIVYWWLCNSEKPKPAIRQPKRYDTVPTAEQWYNDQFTA